MSAAQKVLKGHSLTAQVKYARELVPALQSEIDDLNTKMEAKDREIAKLQASSTAPSAPAKPPATATATPPATSGPRTSTTTPATTSPKSTAKSKSKDPLEGLHGLERAIAAAKLRKPSTN